MNDNMSAIDSMERLNSSSPTNEDMATVDRTDKAMDGVNNESNESNPTSTSSDSNSNHSEQLTNNDSSTTFTNNEPLPTRVHRTVSTEEFEKIVKQFQVKLPPLSYLPIWEDEYTAIENEGNEYRNNDDDGSANSDDNYDSDNDSDNSYDSHDDSEIASNSSFLGEDDSSHEQKQQFRNINSKPYNNQDEKAASGDNMNTVNLPSLPNDITSQILAFVPYLKDVLNYSKTCKKCYENGYNNDLVWNIKFHQRWNAKLGGGMVDPMHMVYEDAFDDIVRSKNHNNMGQNKSTLSSSTTRIARMMKKELFWRRCYYNAFHNVHDLWVSHWNCVMPIDAVSPGRTVIPDLRLQQRSKPNTSQSSSSSSEGEVPTKHNQNCTHSKCPTCRYHPFLNHNGLQELNHAMDQELEYMNQVKKKNEESKAGRPNEPKDVIADPVDDAETTLAMHSILLQRKLNGRSVEDILKLENNNDSRGGNGNGNNNGNNSSQNVQTFLDNLISKCCLKVTPAGAVYQTSQYSLAKWCRRMRVVHNLDLSKRINDDYFTELEDEGINSEDSNDRNDYILKTEDELESISATEYHIQQKRQSSFHAFERSATLRRKIDVNQYRSSGLNFLTDALFFPIEPSHKRMRQLESVVNDEIDKHGDPSQVYWSYKMTDTEHAILDIYGSKIACTEEANSTTSVKDLPIAQPMAPLTDLKNVPAHDLSTLASLGACHETAQHTWHVIRLSNPDFVRPITFRVYAQRKDCFAAYPAEGYLLPGETCHVTLGIRALGSLLAHAFDDTDTKREEAHMFVSDILDEESILPRCGYCIRYFYAPTIPCVPSDHRYFKDPVWLQPNSTLQVEWIPQQNSPSKYSGMIERLWNNVQSEDIVRTIYISTHVNGSYAFDEFQNRTLSPFEAKAFHDGQSKSKQNNNRLSTYPLTLISPNIQERDPGLFNLLHDLDQELVSSHEATNYRTEKGCMSCGRDWGARSEYLGRVYVLRKAVCEEFARQRSRQMHRLLGCLKSIPFLFRHVLPQEGISKVIDVDNNLINKIHQMCFSLHAVLLNKKGDELLTTRQRKLLRSYEIFEAIATEEVLRLLNILFEKDKDQNTSDEGSMFWRHGGIYNTPRSSHLLGESDKPSKHIRESVDSTAGSIIIKKDPAHLKNIAELNHQPGIIPVGKQDDPNHLDNEDSQFFSDIFKDKAILGFSAAMAMIQDPSALIGQGIFHKLSGSIPRCHRIETGSFIPSSHRNIENVCIKGLKKIKSLNVFNGDLLNMNRHVDDALTIFSINDEDFDSIRLISESKKEMYLFSFQNFSKNIAPPGINTRIISSGRIGQSWLPEKLITMYSNLQRHRSRNNNRRRRTRRARPMLGNFGGLRFLNAMWYLSSQVGLSVDDESKPGEILLDRRIMIAAQWMSNSLMFLPLLWTLFARWAMIISPLPLDYYLDGLPYDLKKEMRYLSSYECGWFAILVVFLWLGLGRHAERCVNRTYERSMLDNARASRWNQNAKKGLTSFQHISIWLQIIYDSVCPLVLQKKIFLPEWNKRNFREIVDGIKFTKSLDKREQLTVFNAKDGQIQRDRVLHTSETLSFSLKALLCCVVGIGSFTSVSPHFVQNFCIVFFGSIGMGLSVSINFMEISRSPQVSGVFAKFDNIRFNVAVLIFFLVAQLVGASGGLQFLAEFVVTVAGFLLGGYSTVSSNGFENWFCFFCLSSVSFWGYLFARVGISTCTRKAKSSTASFFLTASFLLMFSIWGSSMFNFDQDFPTGVMLIRYGNVNKARGSATDVLSGQHVMKV